MAFATSNVIQSRDGDLYHTYGTWTGSIGDAAGTVKVPGARIVSMDFQQNLASGGPSTPIPASASGTLPITVTVGPIQQSVTAGTFSIKSK